MGKAMVSCRFSPQQNPVNSEPHIKIYISNHVEDDTSKNMNQVSGGYYNEMLASAKACISHKESTTSRENPTREVIF